MNTKNKWRGRLAQAGLGCLLGAVACQGPASTSPPPREPVEPVESTVKALELPEETELPAETLPAPPVTDLVPEPKLAPGTELRNTRRWQLAHELRDSRGWNLFETEHYYISTPVDSPLLLEGAKRRLEGLFQRLEQDFPAASAHHTSPAPLLRILPSQDAFHKAGGQRGTTAYWDRAKNTLVCFDAGNDVARAKSTWPGLQHVLVHQYLDTILQIADAPKWLLFGVSANYEALRFTASPGGGRWSEPERADLDRALSEAVAADGPMALGRLLDFDSQEFFGTNEFGSGAYRNLVLARSLVAFCWDSSEDIKSRPPAKFLENYTGALSQGLGPANALARALDGRPLGDLNRAWRAWIEVRTGRSLPPGL